MANGDTITFFANDALFDVPSDSAPQFTGAFPGAELTRDFRVGDNIFTIPDSRLEAFNSAFPNAVDVAAETAKQLRVQEEQANARLGVEDPPIEAFPKDPREQVVEPERLPAPITEDPEGISEDFAFPRRPDRTIETDVLKMIQIAKGQAGEEESSVEKLLVNRELVADQERISRAAQTPPQLLPIIEALASEEVRPPARKEDLITPQKTNFPVVRRPAQADRVKAEEARDDRFFLVPGLEEQLRNDPENLRLAKMVDSQRRWDAVIKSAGERNTFQLIGDSFVSGMTGKAVRALGKQITGPDSNFSKNAQFIHDRARSGEGRAKSFLGRFLTETVPPLLSDSWAFIMGSSVPPYALLPAMEGASQLADIAVGEQEGIEPIDLARAAGFGLILKFGPVPKGLTAPAGGAWERAAKRIASTGVKAGEAQLIDPLTGNDMSLENFAQTWALFVALDVVNLARAGATGALETRLRQAHDLPPEQAARLSNILTTQKGITLTDIALNLKRNPEGIARAAEKYKKTFVDREQPGPDAQTSNLVPDFTVVRSPQAEVRAPAEVAVPPPRPAPEVAAPEPAPAPELPPPERLQERPRELRRLQQQAEEAAIREPVPAEERRAQEFLEARPAAEPEITPEVEARRAAARQPPPAAAAVPSRGERPSRRAVHPLERFLVEELGGIARPSAGDPIAEETRAVPTRILEKGKGQGTALDEAANAAAAAGLLQESSPAALLDAIRRLPDVDPTAPRTEAGEERAEERRFAELAEAEFQREQRIREAPTTQAKRQLVIEETGNEVADIFAGLTEQAVSVIPADALRLGDQVIHEGERKMVVSIDEGLVRLRDGADQDFDVTETIPVAGGEQGIIRRNRIEGIAERFIDAAELDPAEVELVPEVARIQEGVIEPTPTVAPAAPVDPLVEQNVRVDAAPPAEIAAVPEVQTVQKEPVETVGVDAPVPVDPVDNQRVEPFSSEAASEATGPRPRKPATAEGGFISGKAIKAAGRGMVRLFGWNTRKGGRTAEQNKVVETFETFRESSNKLVHQVGRQLEKELKKAKANISTSMEPIVTDVMAGDMTLQAAATSLQLPLEHPDVQRIAELQAMKANLEGKTDEASITDSTRLDREIVALPKKLAESRIEMAVNDLLEAKIDKNKAFQLMGVLPGSKAAKTLDKINRLVVRQAKTIGASKQIGEKQREVINDTDAGYAKTSYLRFLRAGFEPDPVARQEAIATVNEGILTELSNLERSIGAQITKLEPGELALDKKALTQDMETYIIEGDEALLEGMPNAQKQSIISIREQTKALESLITDITFTESKAVIEVDNNRVMQQATDYIDYLVSPKARQRYGEGPPPISWQHLSNKFLDGVIKSLYGEIRDPVQRVKLTIDAQTHLIGELGLLEQVYEQGAGRWWDKRPNEELDITKALPKDERFGLLSGMFVQPEIHDVLVARPPSKTSQAYQVLLGYSRLNVLLRVPTVERNLLGNFHFGMQNGDILRLKSYNRGLQRTLRVARGIVNRDPGSLSEQRRLIRDNIMSFRGTSAAKDFAFMIEPLELSRGKTELSATQILEYSKRFLRFVGEKYSLPDTLSKMTSYYQQLDRGMSREQAAAHVARGYQQYNQLPEFVRLAQKMPFMEDFIGFRVDSARMGINTMVDAVRAARGDTFNGKADPIPLIGWTMARAWWVIARGAVLTAASAAAGKFYAAMRQDDDEFDRPMELEQLNALRPLLPKYYENALALAWYDTKGRPNLVMLDYNIPFPLEVSTVAALQREKNPLRAAQIAVTEIVDDNFGLNMLSSILYETVTGKSIDTGFENSDSLVSITEETDPDRFRKAAAALGDLAFEMTPFSATARRNVGRFLEVNEGEAKGLTNEETSISEAARDLIEREFVPVRVVPINPDETIRSGLRKFHFRIRDIKGRLIRLEKKREEQGGLISKDEEMVERMQLSHRQNVEGLISLVNSAKVAFPDMSESKLRQNIDAVVKSKTLAQEYIDGIPTGKFLINRDEISEIVSDGVKEVGAMTAAARRRGLSIEKTDKIMRNETSKRYSNVRVRNQANEEIRESFWGSETVDRDDDDAVDALARAIVEDLPERPLPRTPLFTLRQKKRSAFLETLRLRFDRPTFFAVTRRANEIQKEERGRP